MKWKVCSKFLEGGILHHDLGLLFLGHLSINGAEENLDYALDHGYPLLGGAVLGCVLNFQAHYKNGKPALFMVGESGPFVDKVDIPLRKGNNKEDCIIKVDFFGGEKISFDQEQVPLGKITFLQGEDSAEYNIILEENFIQKEGLKIKVLISGGEGESEEREIRIP